MNEKLSYFANFKTISVVSPFFFQAMRILGKIVCFVSL